MRATLTALTLLYLAGCGDPASFLETPKRKPLSPPGIAQVDDMGGIDPAAASNRQQAGKTKANVSKPAQPQRVLPSPQKPGSPQANPPQTRPAGPGPTQPRPAPKKKSIIGQMTQDVVDLHKFTKQHPNMVVVENKFKGADPLTVAAGAYVTVRARASILGMQQALKQHKVLNDRNPTYDEFMKIMKDHRIRFTALPANRIYAYDSKAGTIVVLEEPAN